MDTVLVLGIYLYTTKVRWTVLVLGPYLYTTKIQWILSWCLVLTSTRPRYSGYCPGAWSLPLHDQGMVDTVLVLGPYLYTTKIQWILSWCLVLTSTRPRYGGYCPGAWSLPLHDQGTVDTVLVLFLVLGPYLYMIKILRLKGRLNTLKRELDCLVDQERDKLVTFQDSVGDNKFSDFLWRLYKKKHRPVKTPDSEDSEEELTSSDSVSEIDDRSGSHEWRDSISGRLDESVCPEGCDQQLYERTLQLRGNRLVLGT
uniref:Uncharacterized protein n=1 Tax=Timema bartmani TaxID=61472 RepID=A0A7R9FCG4_9NEOP|nr:unnamed protein product [Timema bartmani]